MGWVETCLIFWFACWGRSGSGCGMPRGHHRPTSTDPSRRQRAPRHGIPLLIAGFDRRPSGRSARPRRVRVGLDCPAPWPSRPSQSNSTQLNSMQAQAQAQTQQAPSLEPKRHLRPRMDRWMGGWTNESNHVQPLLRRASRCSIRPAPRQLRHPPERTAICRPRRDAIRRGETELRAERNTFPSLFFRRSIASFPDPRGRRGRGKTEAYSSSPATAERFVRVFTSSGVCAAVLRLAGRSSLLGWRRPVACFRREKGGSVSFCCAFLECFFLVFGLSFLTYFSFMSDGVVGYK
ncbi:hypothetical protein BDY21DRAFT_341227 [Lineolata rhizophorae]|uniref:Uncharacterized protein n=1 Tax=Lineolata rhizophorae TaxID=578093 RepID=A0A6A6P4E2_9PEZI|nr:hypothetical protein BDY21DRAFT_341227 [Lineolata rhizophorae]